MNRRGLLASFLAIPAAARLNRWQRPSPEPVQRLSHMTVCSDGGADFTTLAESLKHAAAGATIFVMAV